MTSARARIRISSVKFNGQAREDRVNFLSRFNESEGHRAQAA